MSDPIVSVDEEFLRKDIVELVRKTVQDTLNALLEQEAEEMVGALEEVFDYYGAIGTVFH